MNVYFKPHFYFKGSGWTKILKLIAERVFFGMRNDWVKEANPYIEQVNDEWNRDFPQADLQEEKWSDVYNAYMARGLNTKVSKKPKNRWFMGECSPQTGDFRLVSRKDRKKYVDYDMEVTGFDKK